MVNKAEFTPRAVLRSNLKALMEKAKKDGHRELCSQIQLGKRAKVGQATIGRILSSEGEDSGIETVSKLARAFGLEAWQLMVAGMDPQNPPVLQPISKAERALYERLKDLAKDLK